MRRALLFSVFGALAMATTVQLNEVETVIEISKPRPAHPRELFNRQSTFRCSSGYFCNSNQSCCGIYCCNPGYTCSTILTCDLASTVSTCLSTQTTCGSLCCNSGYYCATDFNCYANAPIAPTCTSSQTVCGTNCCDLGESCSSGGSCYTPTSRGGGSSSSTTCSAVESVCGTSCCSVEEICNADTSSCSSKPHTPKTPKTSTSSKSSTKLPGKALAGIVVGVVAAVGLVITAVLWLCCGCFGGKERREEVDAHDPPAYGEQNKGLHGKQANEVGS